MAVDVPIDLDALVALLAETGDAHARAPLLLAAARRFGARAVAERVKEEADAARYRDVALSLRWSDDAVRLGALANEPAAMALGRMAEGLTLYEQGRYRAALERFDEASALFLSCDDEAGWARVQIGRTSVCTALGCYDEAMQRADEARAILERAGETLRMAALDNNLALLLEQMNRPADAVIYSERVLAAYRGAGSAYYALHALGNHALLLWRLGRAREALEAHQQARQGYADLGATADALREDLNIGASYLTLGHYADAVRLLAAARRELQSTGSLYLAAQAGLSLAECFVRMGRFGSAVEITTSLQSEFSGFEAVVELIQVLLWQSQAHAGLRRYDAALRSLDAASALIAGQENLSSYRITLDVARAQLLVELGRVSEAHALLDAVIPALRAAGLATELCAAQVLWGSAALARGRVDEARAVAVEALAMAEREGLDWLAARALHLRGRVERQAGDGAKARDALAAAARHLDRVHARVAWDDRAAFSSTAAALHGEAVTLAVEQQRYEAALWYAERAKARALAEHLRAGIDVRPRARDDRSRALTDELAALRDRYAWLSGVRADAVAPMPVAAVRWLSGPGQSAAAWEEIGRIERRMAEIWRELQSANPAYRGEAAALDLMDEDAAAGDDDAVAQRWVGRVQAALGPEADVALLEYLALGDDLLLLVLRRGEVHPVYMAGAAARVGRLVTLWRLNVEHSAGAVSGGGGVARPLAANARGLLQRLYDALLAPAAPLLNGVSRLVVVPHGAAHHVPFHALHDGRGYLLERVEVSYAPCSSLIEHFAARQRLLQDAQSGAGRDALVLSCSGGGALSHVALEGPAVAAALGGRLLREDAATLRELRAGAGDCSILHLAAHGVFRPDEPLFSSLQLSDGRLSALEVFELELRCSLVTLSACETSLGVQGAGDELMGLSRAFLYAGAPSLLLSLWKVEDRSTAALMEAFYRALQGGMGKAAALRKAQLSLLHGADGDYSTPYFWAPFHLIGHSGPLIGAG